MLLCSHRYAQWIAESAGADCLELAAAKRMDLSDYDAILFGGPACGGRIRKISWFRSNFSRWPDKRLIAFCVGGSPADSPAIETALNQNFSGRERERVKVFYCPGGFNYEKMPLSSRLMMTLFAKLLQCKKEKTEEEKIMLQMISHSYDLSDRKYTEPILRCLEDGNRE